MLSLEQAKRIALEHLNSGTTDELLHPEDYGTKLRDWAIVQDLTVKTDVGWVFHYQSRTYIETGDSLYKRLGGGPLLVSNDGAVSYLTQGTTIEEALAFWKQENANSEGGTRD